MDDQLSGEWVCARVGLESLQAARGDRPQRRCKRFTSRRRTRKRIGEFGFSTVNACDVIARIGYPSRSRFSRSRSSAGSRIHSSLGAHRDDGPFSRTDAAFLMRSSEVADCRSREATLHCESAAHERARVRHARVHAASASMRQLTAAVARGRALSGLLFRSRSAYGERARESGPVDGRNGTSGLI